MSYFEKLSFQDRNRYSFSGTDCAAFAFYGAAPDVDDQARTDLRELLEDIRVMRSKLAEAETLEAKALKAKREKRQKRIRDKAPGTPKELAQQLTEMEDEAQRLGAKIEASAPVHLESLATISLSIHEPKAPARALGHRGAKGYSRSVRTIAGTMVLLVIEDHPLRALAYQAQSVFGPDDSSWSMDVNSRGQGSYRNPGSEYGNYVGKATRISTLLKPFNLTLSYRSETLPVQKAKFEAIDFDEWTADVDGDNPLGGKDFRTARDIREYLSDKPDPTLGRIYGDDDFDAADGRIKGAKKARNDNRAAKKRDKRNPYSAVNSVKFTVPKVATLMIEGIEIISEGITTSVNDMVTEVVIQFQALDVKQLSCIHESSVMSFPPKDLPDDIYAELRGQAKEATKSERELMLQEYKDRAKQHRGELREQRRARRDMRKSNRRIEIDEGGYDVEM